MSNQVISELAKEIVDKDDRIQGLEVERDRLQRACTEGSKELAKLRGKHNKLVSEKCIPLGMADALKSALRTHPTFDWRDSGAIIDWVKNQEKYYGS